MELKEKDLAILWIRERGQPISFSAVKADNRQQYCFPFQRYDNGKWEQTDRLASFLVSYAHLTDVWESRVTRAFKRETLGCRNSIIIHYIQRHKPAWLSVLHTYCVTEKVLQCCHKDLHLLALIARSLHWRLKLGYSSYWAVVTCTFLEHVCQTSPHIIPGNSGHVSNQRKKTHKLQFAFL